MVSMPVIERMTADEYLALEGEYPRTQLVDGEVVVNQPGLPHQLVVGRLLVALTVWTEEADGRGLATLPLDVRLDERNVYGPDLLWYSEARSPARDAPKPYPIPDLAVEVRSPSTWRYDVGAKKRVYEREGLPELWLVDVDAPCVLVFRRSAPAAPVFDVALELDRAATLSSPLLDGFALSLDRLF